MTQQQLKRVNEVRELRVEFAKRMLSFSYVGLSQTNRQQLMLVIEEAYATLNGRYPADQLEQRCLDLAQEWENLS